MKNLKRCFAILCGVLFLATPLLGAKKVKWDLAMTWPSTLAPFATPPKKLATLVEQMSGGNFVIKVHGKEKHKAALSILDMVKNKQYEMGHSASYYYKGKSIATALLTTTPFGMTSTEQYAWYYYGGGKELSKEIYDKFKVDYYPGGNTGVQMGGWFKKEIKSISDLKGLKMRIPGIAGEVFAKLGVNVTNIPAGELYTSLDRGTIDALEWVGPGMDIKMGFYKVAPYYYTGWHEPATELNFFVNKKAYEKLSKENKVILQTAIKAVTADMLYENFAMSANAWKKIKKEYPNIKIKTFSKDILVAMKKATDEVMANYAKKDPLFDKVYQSQKAFMEKARKWTKISEYDYVKTSETVK